ncbi:MAG TPA: 7-cyano-7-deazaguanine synthase QueC [Coxiellaceae bacterium]|nr:7-cyano-7-deazaguanine synthase QueC [Coxiellaceae bacterium]
MPPKKAIVLVSGGLDSATVLAKAQHEGFECYALSFDYGQRHRAELQAAKRVASLLQAKEHRIIHLGIGALGGSALTDSTLPVPHYSGSHDIPLTYVPARNTIFLAIALGWAEILQAQDIFIGISAIDYSGYPDCRPEFIHAFEKLATIATKAGVEGKHCHIHAPLSHLSKAETIRLGTQLGVDYSQTLSCYSATDAGLACGHCDSCTFRRQGFEAAGIPDPTSYVNS